MRFTDCQIYTRHELGILAGNSPHGLCRIGLVDTKTFFSMGCVKDDDSKITWPHEAMRRGYPWMATSVTDSSFEMDRLIDLQIMYVFSEPFTRDEPIR